MWERFSTAIKIDRIPCLFRSRAAQALAPRVGYCDLEFIWILVLVPALARFIGFILPACGFGQVKQ